MDKISIFGLFIGIAAIVGGQVFEGGHIASLAQLNALIIVLGGTTGAVMLQSPYPVFMRGLKMAKWVWFPPAIDQMTVIR